jgi:hypothetical protein
MRLRRAVAIGGLNRPRLDEAGARLALYPTSKRRRLLEVAVSVGGAFIKSGPEGHLRTATHKESESK